MKYIYVLTAHDSQSDLVIATQHYSNLKAANESFIELKSHLLNKYDIDRFDIEHLGFTDGGPHKTEILNKRFNVTLNKWNVSSKVSTFI